MKIHCHIPKLYDFAIDLACDYVVEHGTAGLDTPMPLPLYLKCQVAFAHKHSRLVTAKKLYIIMQRGIDIHSDILEQADDLVGSSSSCLCTTLDHICMPVADSEVHIIIRYLLDKSLDDVDGVIQCIHRFAARCVSHSCYSTVVSVMTKALKRKPCREIRDVLFHYGGRIDVGDYRTAVGCGRHDIAAKALTVTVGVIVSDCDLVNAVNSGDIDTVSLVMKHSASGGLDTQRYYINAYDFTISYCQLLLSLGVLHKGTHYHVKNIITTHVLQWLHDHDMLDMEHILIEMVNDASRNSTYVDVLHYLIDDLHVTVLPNIYTKIDIKHVTDLGVLGYLANRGADVNVLGAECNLYGSAGLYARYWSDIGLKFDATDFGIVYSIICPRRDRGIFLSESTQDWLKNRLTVVRVLINALNLNVNVRNEHGVSMLHDVCGRNYGDDRYKNMMDAEIEVSDRLHRILLLDLGANIDIQDSNGDCSLHYACGCGSMETVTLLLDRGANANIRNYKGETPMFHAIQASQIEVVQLLIQHGVDVSAVDDNGNTPLHTLVSRKCRRFCKDKREVKIAEMLMAQGVNVNARNRQGQTLLHLAFTGHFAFIDFLLCHHADVNVADNTGITPLHLACSVSPISVTIVRDFILCGADVKARDSDGRTPLHCICDSAIHDKDKMNDYDDDEEIDYNAGDDDNVPKLGYITTGSNSGDVHACIDIENEKCLYDKTPYVNVVNWLVQKGADVNVRDKYDQTPLQIIDDRHREWVRVAKKLLRHKANTDGYIVYNVFRAAIEHYKFNLMDMICSHPIDVNATPVGCVPLLQCAVEHDDVDYDVISVGALLEHGADVNMLNNDGGIKLIKMANECDDIMTDIKQFIIARCNDSKYDGYGRNEFFHHACGFATLDVVKFWLEIGADLHCVTDNERTTLHSACENGMSDVVEYLLSRGCDVNARDAEGLTPLHLAYANGEKWLIRLLIDHGADVNIVDNNGHTPEQHREYVHMQTMSCIQSADCECLCVDVQTYDV